MFLTVQHCTCATGMHLSYCAIDIFLLAKMVISNNIVDEHLQYITNVADQFTHMVSKSFPSPEQTTFY